MFYDKYIHTTLTIIFIGLAATLNVRADFIKPIHIDNHSHIITVTTTVDEDNGYLGGGMGISLREALTHSEEGTIIIVPKGRFVFDDGFGTIEIPRDYVLKGSGISKTVIDGNENGSVFRIAENAELSISDLTITGGNALKGGAIYNEGGVHMYAVVLSGNRAADGGALYNKGTADLWSCILRDNNAGYYGGGIHNNGGRVHLTDVGLLRNTATKGGGMYNQFGFAAMNNGTILGNVAGTGGGVTDYIGLTEISNTSAADNYGGNYEGQVLTLGDNFDSDGTSRFEDGIAGDKVLTTVSPAGLAHSARSAY